MRHLLKGKADMSNVRSHLSKYTWRKFKLESPYYLMVLPGALLVLLFSYVPMGGLVIAFQRFIPAKGFFGDQKWVGLKNFEFVFTLPGFQRALINTVVIALFKMAVGIIVPLVFALLLNEVSSTRIRRSVQTMIYLPYFLSWVILGGVLTDILSPNTGIANRIITLFGGQPIFFLGDNAYFRGTLIVTNIWKDFGFGTVVYLAAIMGVDQELYEAAIIDGANRWQQTWHITLPGMRMIIVLMCVLSLGNVLNAGFDQVFNLYNTSVYETGDIIDTFVYRMGLLDAQFGPATAVGFFKSVISFLFISISYLLAYRLADYRVF
jgi:putative aldouronate transport system permease protein